MPAKQIPLQDWAERHFDPPPSIRTLRSWARKGLISPAPVLVGREYRVREDAAYISSPRPLHIAPVVVLDSKDPVVNEIVINGKTKERRQA